MSYRNLTESELAEPLTKAELKSYDEYLDRRTKDAHLQAQKEEIIKIRTDISAYPFRHVLAPSEFKKWFKEHQLEIFKLEDESLKYRLKPWEEESYFELAARIQWHRDLAEYRHLVERVAFDSFNISHLEYLGVGYNLPVILKQYDNIKLLCGTSGLLQLARRKQRYAQDILLQLEQEDSALWLTLDPNKQLGEARRAVLGEVIGKLFASFLEHIMKDLAESPPITEANEDSTSAQQVEHGQPEVASGAEAEPILKEESASIQASEKPVEAVDPRDASEELEIYLSEFSTVGCDELAEAVGLSPPAPTQRKNRVLPYRPRRGAKTKIYAIADVLDDPEFDRVRPGQKTEFIKALGRRLGFPSEKPERNSGSVSYDSARETARKRLKALIEEGNKRK
jgi:hypothetical protein